MEPNSYPGVLNILKSFQKGPIFCTVPMVGVFLVPISASESTFRWLHLPELLEKCAPARDLIVPGESIWGSTQWLRCSHHWSGTYHLATNQHMPVIPKMAKSWTTKILQYLVGEIHWNPQVWLVLHVLPFVFPPFFEWFSFPNTYAPLCPMPWRQLHRGAAFCGGAFCRGEGGNGAGCEGGSGAEGGGLGDQGSWSSWSTKMWILSVVSL